MKYVKLFAVITLALILGSGLFVWVTHVGKVATLSYVPDPDWSKRRIILPYIEAETYRAAIDSESHVQTIWLKYDQDGHKVSLMHMSTNTKGRLLVEPHVVFDAPEIDEISLTIVQDSLRVLWTGKGDHEKRDLNYLEMGRGGEILAQRKILTNELHDGSSLQAIPVAEEGILVTWADQASGHSTIQTLVLDTDGNATGQPEILPLKDHALYPKLALDAAGRIHMTWQEELEYGYGLYYLQLTADGRPAMDSIFIDTIDLNSVAMAATEEKIFLAWGTILPKEYRQNASIVEKAFPNYAIFGTTLNVDHPVQRDEVVPLTDELGPAFDQNLIVDEKGRVNMVFIDTYYDTLGLTHQIFGKDFTDVKKAARRLYPDQRIVLQTRLLPDPNKGMHLVWMQSDMYSGSIYYANNLHRQWISPLQIIGLNAEKQGISAFMSLGYTLGISFYSLFIHLHFLLLTILGALLTGCIYLFHKKPWGEWLGHRFVAPTILGGVTVLLYLTVGRLFGVSHWLVWPKFYDSSQIWFIVLLATVATAYYIIKSKIRNNDMLKLTIAVMFWFYWMHMINFIFNLPVLNFT